jgi:hypothetical protein
MWESIELLAPPWQEKTIVWKSIKAKATPILEKDPCYSNHSHLRLQNGTIISSLSVAMSLCLAGLSNYDRRVFELSSEPLGFDDKALDGLLLGA